MDKRIKPLPSTGFLFLDILLNQIQTFRGVHVMKTSFKSLKPKIEELHYFYEKLSDDVRKSPIVPESLKTEITDCYHRCMELNNRMHQYEIAIKYKDYRQAQITSQIINNGIEDLLNKADRLVANADALLSSHK